MFTSLEMSWLCYPTFYSITYNTNVCAPTSALNTVKGWRKRSCVRRRLSYAHRERYMKGGEWTSHPFEFAVWMDQTCIVQHRSIVSR